MSLLSVVKDIAVKIGTEVIKHQAEVLLVGGVTLAVGATVATVNYIITFGWLDRNVSAVC